MIRYRTGKIILKFPPFCQLNITRNIKSGKIQTNVTLRSKWDVFVCVCVFVFIRISHSWSCSFEIQKGGNFKIIFPVPYPIIYNTYLKISSYKSSGRKQKKTWNNCCQLIWIDLWRDKSLPEESKQALIARNGAKATSQIGHFRSSTSTQHSNFDCFHTALSCSFEFRQLSTTIQKSS